MGRVRRKNTKKLLGAIDKNTNYMRVCMKDKQTGSTSNEMVHRLIYFSFYPEALPNKDNIQIDHINGIRTDNRLINL